MRREWKRKSFVTAGKTWLMKVFFIAGLSLPSATAVTRTCDPPPRKSVNSGDSLAGHMSS